MDQKDFLFRRFLRSESGAVTVDWVVLTAGLVGLGLAVGATVRGGVQSTANGINDTLGGTLIQTSFSILQSLANNDFADGPGDWVGGTVVDLAGFGEVLQLTDDGTGTKAASLALEVPEGATSATLSFDLIAGDDLDDDPATIFVNGEMVSVFVDDHGSVSVSNFDVPGVTVQVENQYTNQHTGAGGHGKDSRSTFTITVDDPGTSLTLGVESGTDEPESSEFFAIDDVSVSSS